MVSEIPRGLGWNHAVKRKATSQELTKISPAPGRPPSMSFLVTWAAAVIWPQEFRSKPADVWHLQAQHYMSSYTPGMTPCLIRGTSQLESWAALPAEYSSPGDVSETEEKVSSSSTGKAALP